MCRLHNAILALILTPVAGGCSFLAYTPVVTSAALGGNRAPVEDSRADLIGQRVNVPVGADLAVLSLSGGSTYIGPASATSNRVECGLDGQSFEILDVYDDRINGGTFLDASVNCDGRKILVKRTPWDRRLTEWT